MRLCVCFATVLAACSSAPRPAPKPAEVPVVVVAKPTLQRLLSGGLGGTPHRWSSRFFELRTVRAGASGTALEVRVHDETHFQGVGMRPDQMPPTQHSCTAWELLPAAIRVPASATSCTEAKDECAAIEQHLRATDRTAADGPAPLEMPMPVLPFGRSLTGCG